MKLFAAAYVEHAKMSASSNPQAYRDETETLQARVGRLEAELAAKEKRVSELEDQLSDHDAVFTRLKGVIDQKEIASGRGSRSLGRLILTGGAAALVTATALVVFGSTFIAPRRPSSTSVQANAVQAPAEIQTVPPMEKAAQPATTPLPAPLDVCRNPGVHLTVGGTDARAPAQNDRDLAGHKYRRDGSRSPWLTVNGGPLYVHAVGDFLPGDVGTTQLSILTLQAKGDTSGYALAHGGKSVLEIQGSNGKHIYGRFEADVSKVADTTRTPPFGTPVERVRGTFCLPAFPANPSDTGP